MCSICAVAPSREVEGGGGGEEYDICEGDAWEFQSAVEEDMEGGHSAFPLLDPHSDLAERLTKLYMEVV